MTAFEYIKETIPDELNWNILSQLLEEEGIDLEEIEGYLKTTPWNTNLAIVEQLLQGDGADGPIVFTMDNLTAEFSMINGGCSLPQGIEKLSEGDSINVEARFSKGYVCDCNTTVTLNMSNELQINVYEIFKTCCTSSALIIGLPPDPLDGIMLDGTTDFNDPFKDLGTSVTFTITKI